MIGTILCCLLTAIVSGFSGYCISTRFHGSNHAKTDRSGDFGSPSGTVFATMSGMLIGAIFIRFAASLSIFPAGSIGPAFIAATIVGAAAGFVPLIRAAKPG